MTISELVAPCFFAVTMKRIWASEYLPVPTILTSRSRIEEGIQFVKTIGKRRWTREGRV